MTDAVWVDVRCDSPACDRADRGGRLLFKRSGNLVTHASRSSSLIALTPLGAICKCGARWRNPDLEAPTDLQVLTACSE